MAKIVKIDRYPLPLFPEEVLRYVSALTTANVGAWILLLLAAWRRPEVTLWDDDRKLARIAHLPLATWRKHKNAILGDGGWELTPNGWTHPRLQKERGSALQRAISASIGASARWNGQRARNSDENAQKNIDIA